MLYIYLYILADMSDNRIPLTVQPPPPGLCFPGSPPTPMHPYPYLHPPHPYGAARLEPILSSNILCTQSSHSQQVEKEASLGRWEPGDQVSGDVFEGVDRHPTQVDHHSVCNAPVRFLTSARYLTKIHQSKFLYLTDIG